MQIISRCRRHLVRDHSSSISVEVSFLLRGAHVVFKENKVGSVVANKGRAMENWLPQSKGGRGGRGGEEEGGIINYRVSGRIDKPSVTSIPPIIPGRPGMGCGQPSQAIQDRQAQTHLLGFFMNDSSACPKENGLETGTRYSSSTLSTDNPIEF